jgi:hypothetical protein
MSVFRRFTTSIVESAALNFHMLTFSTGTDRRGVLLSQMVPTQSTNSVVPFHLRLQLPPQLFQRFPFGSRPEVIGPSAMDPCQNLRQGSLDGKSIDTKQPVSRP